MCYVTQNGLIGNVIEQARIPAEGYVHVCINNYCVNDQMCGSVITCALEVGESQFSLPATCPPTPTKPSLGLPGPTWFVLQYIQM